MGERGEGRAAAQAGLVDGACTRDELPGDGGPAEGLAQLGQLTLVGSQL